MLTLLLRPPPPAFETIRIEHDGEVYDVEARPLVIKAGGTPAGARWITVHSHGKDEKGTPVLIQETESGSGVYHVIGGAGGKLNYLKLRGVKSKEEYAQDVRNRQADKRQQRKEQTKREKESGTYESKQAQRESVRNQAHTAERKFIEDVGRLAGWDEKDLQLPEEKVSNLSEGARKKAEAQHHRELLKRANDVANLHQQLLTVAADERLADVLQEPMGADPEAERSLGYQPGYTEQTQDQADDIKAEAAAINSARTNPEQAAARATAKERAKAIRAELAANDLSLKPVKAAALDTAKAMEIMRAKQALKKVAVQAKAANKAIDRGEEKAYVLDVSAPDDSEIERDVEKDLRTARTRTFLSEVSKQAGGEQALGRHLVTGAFNALNGVSLAVSGGSQVDRNVVDVLGIAGAAQALAQRLRADLPADEYDQALEALEKYHVEHYMQRSQDALLEAQDLEDQIREMKLPEASDGHELAAAQELNQRRRSAIRETRKVLGQALGEMEANAALLVAMKAKSASDAKVPLGMLSTEEAIKRLRAIGLGRGDYQIEHAGGEVIATVNPDGLKRLAQPADVEHARAVRDSMGIIDGAADDPNFWPQGVARRPDLALAAVKPSTAEPLAKPFTPSPDLAQSMRDYIGGRMADGHSIEDIVNDLQSEDLARTAGDRRSEYFRALDSVVPLSGGDGKPLEAEHRRGDFERFADDFVSREYGGRVSPIHSQSFDASDKSAEALHRAFATHPTGPLAFRQLGDLEPADRNALRTYFDANIAKSDAKTADLRSALGEHLKNEPEREVDDMFGRGTNPAWTDWKNRGDEMRAELGKSGLDWDKYKTLMGSPEAAYAAIQDHLRGRVVEKFHGEYSRLVPDHPLKLGRTVLSNNLRHVEAVDPEARERRLQQHKELVDSLRNRVAGRYSGGSVTDRLDAVRERQAAMEQAQIGMFATEPEDAKAERPLEADERHTIGAAAEAKLGQMAESIGANFKPGQKVQVRQPSLSGKYINQQRAIKLIERNKRIGLAQGVGSGKTSMGLGAWAHLHSQSKCGRAIFAVPSIVQGQFGSEALSMLEPGKFKWHAQPGASREERLAAYADPKTHFSVVTHQALRDDLLHVGAKARGITEQQMAEKLDGMSGDERNAWAAETMKAAGINHDFLMVDEGDNLLNRAGKENSAMANTIDSVANNMQYYVSATADPVKNDASEIYDVLHKLDPKRYTDRDAFMRKYGVDTQATKDQLRREMARYIYPGRIDPGVRVLPRQQSVDLTDAQNDAIKQVEDHVAKLRTSRLQGKLDVDAARALSPGSFEGQQESEHQAIAKRIADGVGFIRESAVKRVIDAHPDGAKLTAIAKAAHERRGKPGVIFARSRDAVDQISERLRKEGHRVVTITGADSAKEKYAKRLKFRPEAGAEPEADILVASDAGAVGMNAQRGAWLAQNDTPATARTHAQRNGRIDRLGQKNPEIELLDFVAKHPVEEKARARLKTKYALREIMTSPLEGLDDHGYAAFLRQQQRAHQLEAA